MELTVITQSLLPSKPGEPDRWPLVAERLHKSGLEPDWVLLNECRGWAADNNAHALAAAADLGMQAMPVSMSASGLATLILYRAKTVGEPLPMREPTQTDPGILNEDYTGRTYHGWSIGAWEVGLPQPLVVCSYKLTPYSVDAARAEAAYTGTHIYRRGTFGVAGGDQNFSPLDPRNPPPDWRSQHPYNIGSRAVPGTGAAGQPEPDRSVALQFADKGLWDAAWQYAESSGDLRCLRHTSEYDRIDIGLVTAPLLPAVTGYWTLQRARCELMSDSPLC
jgi:hypothetical protein